MRGLDDDVAAVVYDLDGTLVRLAVDWESARDEVAKLYRDAGVRIGDEGLWELLEQAPEHGLLEEVEAIIAEYERAGAAAADRLPTADELARRSRPAGVVSLNCEAACRIALEKHNLLDGVEVIVGRDSVGTHKPDPEPLLAAVRALNVDAAETMFIGDSERDKRTAARAGTRFSYVGDGPSGY